MYRGREGVGQEMEGRELALLVPKLGWQLLGSLGQLGLNFAPILSAASPPCPGHVASTLKGIRGREPPVGARPCGLLTPS